MAINRKQAELQAIVEQKLMLIALMQQQNAQNNLDALLVLSMAYPWLGGEIMQ